jgi:hypothetical protein
MRQLVDREPFPHRRRAAPACGNDRSRMESSLMVDWWSPDHRQCREEIRQILDCLSRALLHVIVSG